MVFCGAARAGLVLAVVVAMVVAMAGRHVNVGWELWKVKCEH